MMISNKSKYNKRISQNIESMCNTSLYCYSISLFSSAVAALEKMLWDVTEKGRFFVILFYFTRLLTNIA